MIEPFSCVALGAPKLGKSTFATSIAELILPEKVVCLITKPNEINSYGYDRYQLRPRCEIFYDRRWRPSMGSFQADAFVALMQRIYALYDDGEAEAVILDVGTDVCEMNKHRLLAPIKAASLSDLRDQGKDANYSYWDEFAESMKEFFQALTNLATPVAKKPKFVIVTWHVQPPKEGQTVSGVYKKSVDERGSGVTFEGTVLPMIDGAYRLKLAADVDAVVFFDVEAKLRQKVAYQMRVVPNNERHAGIRLAPSLAEEVLPNNFKALVDAIEKARQVCG